VCPCAFIYLLALNPDMLFQKLNCMYFTLADKGNHDWLIDQLIYNDEGELRIQEPKPLNNGEETKHEEDEKCKPDTDDIKNVKMATAHDTKSMSDKISESNLKAPNISNVEASVSQKPGSGPTLRFSLSHERPLNLPFSSTDTTPINESMFDIIPSPIDKRQETMFLGDRRICRTPTLSIASDLQVEVSEVGSPTSTVDDSDRDSALYDGDIDKGVSSGSEDLWGASFHGRGGARNEEDNNGEDVSKVVSPISLRQIDEDVANVSSYSSRDEGPDDTPTCCAVNTDHNVFGNYMEYSEAKNDVPQSSNSSDVTTPQNELIGSSMDQLPNETHQEKQQVSPFGLIKGNYLSYIPTSHIIQILNWFK